MVRAFNTSSWEVEAGRSLRVPGQPGVHNELRLHSETLDKKQNQNKENQKKHRDYVSGLRCSASAWHTQGVNRHRVTAHFCGTGYHPGLQKANAKVVASEWMDGSNN